MIARKLFSYLIAIGISGGTANAVAEEFSAPWRDAEVAIILDPFHGNRLNFDAVATDRRVAAMIHKASQGLGADSRYLARRSEAKSRGYLWGSYHLLTTADPVAQIDHYLGIVGNDAAEAHALDVECLAATANCQSDAFKVSIENVEKALLHFKEKTGALPLLYANHSVKSVLATRFAGRQEFAGLKLWYARFRENIGAFFPDAMWQSYSVWQFASEINCKPEPESCPYRVPGTRHDMDLNVFNGSIEALKAQWPLTQ